MRGESDGEGQGGAEVATLGSSSQQTERDNYRRCDPIVNVSGQYFYFSPKEALAYYREKEAAVIFRLLSLSVICHHVLQGQVLK